MKAIYLLSPFLILYIFSACQPSLLVKKEKPEARVDSVLFYQQKDLPDPFIDAVIAAGPDTLVLHTKRIPPPPPPKKFRQIDGFRVQVFAGLDSLNALSTRYRLKDVRQDSVYLLKDRGLFKIQIGDFPYRNEAETTKRNLRKNGFPGAWVVQTRINIPLDSAATVPPEKEATPAKQELEDGLKIQVLATGDSLRAEETVNKLKKKYKLPARFQKSGSLFKVYLGRFSTREEAQPFLERIRKDGYPDAWIVK